MMRRIFCVFQVVWLIAGMLAIGMLPAEAAGRPVLTVAGFASRIQKSDITMTDIDTPIALMLRTAKTVFDTELSGDPRFALYDGSAGTARARADEAALVNALGKGQIDPVLAQHADYICYGYLTMLSNVKAQSGVLVFSGSDKTVYAELSLRVLDTHTHTIVYAGKADSRRKAALSYHAILQRADSGAEDAIRQAISDAAVNLAAQLKEAM